MAELLDLPALLQGLADARRTGTLVVHGPGGRRALLHLREGTIAGAWDGDPDVLGKALVRTGVLGWERLAELVDFFRPAPAALERVVVEQGDAAPEDVARARAFVAREVLFDVLTWSDARAELKEGPPLPDLVRVDMAREDVAVATKPALMHATVQRDEWMRFRAVVPSDGDVLVPRPDSEVGADGAHADVLALVDGERDVHELLGRACLPRAEAGRILRELLVAGAVRVLDRAELLALARRVRGAPEAPGPARDRALRVLRRAEELAPLTGEDALWLACAEEARGATDEAARRFVALARSGSVLGAPAAGSDAALHLRRALRLRPDDGQLQRDLVEVLLAQGAVEEAALQTEHYVGWLRLRKDPAATLRAARDLLERLGEFEEMLLLRADLAEQAGDRLEALTVLREVAASRTDGPSADDVPLEEKLAVLRRVAGLDPQDAAARLRLGELLAETDPAGAAAELSAFAPGGQHAAAAPEARLAALTRLAALAPGRPLSGALATAHLDAGRAEDAAAAIEAGLAAGEPASLLLPAAERLVAHAQDLPSARLLARARAAAGDARAGGAELTRAGRAALLDGDAASSLQAFREAIALDPLALDARAALDGLLAGDPAQTAARAENLRALAAVARIQGDAALAGASREALRSLDPSDPALGIELLKDRLAQGGEVARAALESFLAEHEAAGNRGLCEWARAQCGGS